MRWKTPMSASTARSQHSKPALRLERRKPPIDKTAVRAELVEALRFAVEGERRFGHITNNHPELDQRWAKAIDLIEKLVA